MISRTRALSPTSCEVAGRTAPESNAVIVEAQHDWDDRIALVKLVSVLFGLHTKYSGPVTVQTTSLQMLCAALSFGRQHREVANAVGTVLPTRQRFDVAALLLYEDDRNLWRYMQENHAVALIHTA